MALVGIWNVPGVHVAGCCRARRARRCQPRDIAGFLRGGGRLAGSLISGDVDDPAVLGVISVAALLHLVALGLEDSCLPRGNHAQLGSLRGQVLRGPRLFDVSLQGGDLVGEGLGLSLCVRDLEGLFRRHAGEQHNGDGADNARGDGEGYEAEDPGVFLFDGL